MRILLKSINKHVGMMIATAICITIWWVSLMSNKLFPCRKETREMSYWWRSSAVSTLRSFNRLVEMLTST